MICENKKEQFKGNLEYAFNDGREDISYYFMKVKEYLAFAETIVPDVKECPVYQEVFALENEFKSLISRAKDSSDNLYKTIIPAVEMAIYCSTD